MKHTEYIIPIGEEAKDYDEMFIAVIRKQPELIRCKDCKKHNKEVGIDENFNPVYKDDACPLVSWRGKAKGHEFDYQFCCCAERKTE